MSVELSNAQQFISWMNTKSYLNTLSQSAAELGMSAEKYAAMRTLIADMLEYGAKAQVYLNYKTDSLVNEGVTEQSEFVALNPEDCDEILEQSGKVHRVYQGHYHPGKQTEHNGIAYATEQIVDLFANGVNAVHVYTMNKPDVAQKIMENLSEILG